MHKHQGEPSPPQQSLAAEALAIAATLSDADLAELLAFARQLAAASRPAPPDDAPSDEPPADEPPTG